MLRFLFFSALIICLPVSAQTVDAKGQKQGYWKKKDEKTGKLLYEGEFKDDKPVGKFKYYYPNDSVKAIITFRSGGPASYARLYHPTGKRMAEGKYKAPEVKDSVWTYYDETGILLSRETFVNGKREGNSFIYMPDGTISEEKTWRNDHEEGTFTQYFEKDKVKVKGSYKNGKMHGRFVYYFPNGVEAAAGFYRDGQKNGPWLYRDSQGKIIERELFKDGVKAGDKETEEFFKKNPAKNNTSAKPASKTPASKSNKTDKQ